MHRLFDVLPYLSAALYANIEILIFQRNTKKAIILVNYLLSLVDLDLPLSESTFLQSTSPTYLN